MMATRALREQLRLGPYQGYAYAYPHKSAYRTLTPPVDLAHLWAQEDRRALFAYLHIPFCTYRCGFCNLFALGSPGEDLVEHYVEQLVRQLAVVGGLLGGCRFARFALGGGTPSYLTARQLERVLAAAQRHLCLNLQSIPAGIEVSPETATHERLQLCREVGLDRVSMGVQSFSDVELQALMRPAQPREVAAAVDVIRALGFPLLNLDLIYGIAGQSPASFEQSLMTALSFEPEELYLYPLYVRAQTGLGRRPPREPRCSDQRMQMYCLARERLQDAGYRQISMRMFRSAQARTVDGPVYCCQEDGMVGVGCGARSYTHALHYSDRYAMERAGVSHILRQYIEADAQTFAQAYHGFALDAAEQRRRYVIQSLLTWPGLDERAYTTRFGTSVLADLPQLTELLSERLAVRDGDLLALTAEGLAQSDAIGPWLNSPVVTERMHGDASA
jgi:oxygen-independent coproporphyrinogen-3 oxidase